MTRPLVLVLALAAACAPAAPPVPAPAPAPSTTPTATTAGAAQQAEVPHGVRWFRTAAEHRAAFLQAYRQAAEGLNTLPDTLWGVILDADETVLDNSTYQLRRAREGLGYTEESWNAWVREEAAPALPGAAEFTRLVRERGGRVAIVTNRDESVCEPTRRNLRQVGVVFDVVLCKPSGPGGSDKNPRFRAVQEGRAPGVPPIEVLLWVGDNIQDFPGLTQAVRGQGEEAFAQFGRRYIILPNPMYGSWERNPVP